MKALQRHGLVSSLLLTLCVSAPAFAAHPQGFLTADEVPNSLKILPPPPAETSVAFLSDKADYEAGRVLKDKAREELAARDADYNDITQIFSVAYGQEISPQHTPALYSLLQKVLQDSHDHAMKAAKNHYMRLRPFVLYKDPTCTPAFDEKMKGTGSYPSGHASFGWAAALVLAEINPARQSEILQRGYDFGQSRVICGAHWQSDVDSGRLMGSAVVAALHNNAAFMTALGQAKAELHQTAVATQ